MPALGRTRTACRRQQLRFRWHHFGGGARGGPRHGPDPGRRTLRGLRHRTCPPGPRTALRGQLERSRAPLDAHQGIDLGALCYTGNIGRAHQSLRGAGGVASENELAALLDRHLAADGDKRSRGSAGAVIAFASSTCSRPCSAWSWWCPVTCRATRWVRSGHPAGSCRRSVRGGPVRVLNRSR